MFDSFYLQFTKTVNLFKKNSKFALYILLFSFIISIICGGFVLYFYYKFQYSNHKYISLKPLNNNQHIYKNHYQLLTETPISHF